MVETADLFLHVKPAEATAEQLQVQLMKGAARYFLGLIAAVKDLDVTELQQESTSEITETIQRLEKELEREQSPILLALEHLSLGCLFLQQKEGRGESEASNPTMAQHSCYQW